MEALITSYAVGATGSREMVYEKGARVSTSNIIREDSNAGSSSREIVLRETRSKNEIIQDHLFRIFDYLFDSAEDEVQKNTRLFLFLNDHLEDEDLIRAFLADSSIEDLAPSYLKSILIMTDRLPNMDDEKRAAQELFERKMQS